MKKIILLIFAFSLILTSWALIANTTQAEDVVTLKKVKNVRVVKKGNKYITLKWNKVTNAESYKIKVMNKKKKKLKIENSTKIKKKIKNLKKNRVYNFRVRAINGDVKGKWSIIKKVRTKNIDPTPDPDPTPTPTPEPGDFAISSTAFDDDGAIPIKYTHWGDDVNPALSWENAPEGTESFVLTVIDIDASDFVHWGVKDISSSATGVAENSVPTEGNQLPNSFIPYSSIYQGPYPPSGTHRYEFRLYALDIAEVIGDTVAEVETNMSSHILEQLTLTGTYTAP
ncbi:MAG: YbhB/YbcL family Raf kinase inhibitor-like protein [Patescibacteria group bacterium]